jgi:hypothetical protein
MRAVRRMSRIRSKSAALPCGDGYAAQWAVAGENGPNNPSKSLMTIQPA